MLRLVLLMGLVVTTTDAMAIDCAELERRERYPDNEAAIWSSQIWDTIVVAATTIDLRPDKPSLKIIRHDAPSAWYCRQRDTVYVASRLVEYSFGGRGADGADFLGFVLAHELAHRRFDGGAQHKLAGACPDGDAPIEAAADRRATFLLAIAKHPTTGRGFSPFELARRDSRAAFFEAELGWDAACPMLATRVAATRSAVDRMATYAVLYDVTLTLAAAGDEAAVAVAAALRDGIGGDGWDAVPELGLVRAALHLAQANASGWCPPGMANSGADPDPCTLPCAVALPRFPRLAPVDVRGTRGEQARRDALLAARRELDQAARGGLDKGALAGAEACHAYLSRDPNGALRWARLQAPSVAVEANRRLFELQRALLEETAPVLSDEWLAHLVGWSRPGHEATSLDPTKLAIGSCGQPTSRFAARDMAVRKRGACVDLVAPGFVVTIEPLVLSTAARGATAWLAACDGPRLALDDGRWMWGSACSQAARSEAFVVTALGGEVERAQLVTRTIVSGGH